MTSSDKGAFVREATGLTRQISGWDSFLGNIRAMGIACIFVFEYFATLLFPGVVRKKLGGVPAITILGIIGVVVNVYFGWATALPAISPSPSGTILVQYLAYATVPLTIVAAFVIYGISYTVSKRQGIALGAAFKEIPPD
jgi:hypothetical protein